MYNKEYGKVKGEFRLDEHILMRARESKKESDLEIPTVPASDQFYHNAFYILSTCRNNHGMIPWRDIQEYGKQYGMNTEELEDFFEIIQRFDKEAANHGSGTNNKNSDRPKRSSAGGKEDRKRIRQRK